MIKPIRILQVVTHMNRGGLETMIMNYYRKIDRTNVQFDFLTHRPELEKKDYDEEIKSMGGKIYHIRELNPFSRKYKNELKKFFKTHSEYKVIHVHQDCLSGVILKVAEECGIQTRIAHCHSSNQDKNIKYFIKLYYKRKISKYATDLFSCGQKSGEWMFGKNSDFTILPNAIDTEQFAFSNNVRKKMRLKLGVNEENIVIGHVGRFSNVKNHVFMIDLFEYLHNKNQNYKMVFVGNGELFDECTRKVNALGLKDEVLFLGLRNDVPDLLQAFDIFMLPSLYEGVPVSIIEAQTAGLKCFISDKVPSDCSLTNLVIQLPLSMSVEEWAHEIMSCSFDNRNQYREKIAKTGYDIIENVVFLERFYISKYKRGE